MTIPQELQHFVDGAVASGAYRSSEDVVSAALRLLQERDRKLSALRADLKIGMEQLDRGEAIAIADEAAHDAYFKDIERRGQQRLAAKKERP